MIHNDVELERAREEVAYLKGFLRRVERSPEEPNKELSIIGIYKKLDHLWDELDAYYQARLGLESRPARQMSVPVPG